MASSKRDTFSPASSTYSDFEVISSPKPESEDSKKGSDEEDKKSGSNSSDEIVVIPEEKVEPVEEAKIDAIHKWNDSTRTLELSWKKEDEKITPKKMRRSLNENEFSAKGAKRMIEMTDRPQWLFLFSDLDKLLTNSSSADCAANCRYREQSLLEKLDSSCQSCQTYALLYVYNTAKDLEKIYPQYKWDPMRDGARLVRCLDSETVDIARIYYGVTVCEEDEPPYRFIMKWWTDSPRNPDFIPWPPREWAEAGYFRKKWIEFKNRKVKNVDYGALEAVNYNCNAACIFGDVQKTNSQKIFEAMKKWMATQF